MSMLKRGSKGAAVEAWQRALNDAMSPAHIVVDSQFGPATEWRTREFQRRARLDDDGVVGPATRAVMSRQPFSQDTARLVIQSQRVPRSSYPLHLLVDLTCKFCATRAELAAWAAQVAHESAGFKYVREVWGPTAAQKRYEPPSSLARRLGNTEPGDGFRFRGRGPIQVTGRANYADMANKLNLPLLEQPELLEVPAYGLLAAMRFWSDRNLHVYADRVFNGRVYKEHPFVTLTKRINGGMNGLTDRQKRFAECCRLLGIA